MERFLKVRAKSSSREVAALSSAFPVLRFSWKFSERFTTWRQEPFMVWPCVYATKWVMAKSLNSSCLYREISDGFCMAYRPLGWPGRAMSAAEPTTGEKEC